MASKISVDTFFRKFFPRLGLSEDSGTILLISLLIMMVMLILSLSAIFRSSIDFKIATNTKTATKALYVADSGMNMIRKEVVDNASTKFISTPPTTTTTEFTVGATLSKTLRNPANWGWDCSSPSIQCTDNSFPITKTYTVAGKSASISIPIPVWEGSKDADGNWIMGSAPGTSTDDDPNYFTLTFKGISSTETESTLQVAGNIRVEFGNNLLYFQNNPTQAPSEDNPNYPTYDEGISASVSEMDIEGVATNFDSARLLVIYKYESTTSKWEIFAEPYRNSSEYTFRVADTGVGRVYYYPRNTPSPNNWFPGSATITNAAGEPTIATVYPKTVGSYSNLRLPVISSSKIDVVTGATVASRGLSNGDKFRVEVKLRSSLIPTNQLSRLEEINGVTFNTLGSGCVSVIGVNCSTLHSTQWKSFY